MVQTSLSASEIEKLPPNFLSDERAVTIIRNVVMRCWVTTPKEKQTLAEVTSRVNRLVEEALRQLEEDLAEECARPATLDNQENGGAKPTK
jgi:hypothetical protein